MAVESFLPSRHGFAYTNAWPEQPAVILPTPFGDIGIGNAGGGLCGGMAFAALDFWLAGRAPGLDRPSAGDPLYRYIVNRLIDSWHAPAGVAQYYQWMSLPDGDNVIKLFGRWVITERGLGWRTVRVQWPQIKKDLDRGHSHGHQRAGQAGQLRPQSRPWPAPDPWLLPCCLHSSQA